MPSKFAYKLFVCILLVLYGSCIVLVLMPSNIKNNLVSDGEISSLKGWYYYNQDKIVEVELPIVIPCENNECTIYCRLPENLSDSSINTSFRYQDYQIAIDGKVLDSFDSSSLPLNIGKLNVTKRIVKLPMGSAGKLLSITSKSYDQKDYCSFSDVFIGSESSILSYFLHKNGLRFLLAFSMFLTSLVLIIFSIVVGIKIGVNSELLFLSIFAATLNAFLLSSSDLIQLLTDNTVFINLAVHIPFILLPITFSVYVLSIEKSYEDKFLSIFILIEFLMILVMIILQVTGIAIFVKTIYFIHLSLIINVAYTFYLLFVKSFNNKENFLVYKIVSVVVSFFTVFEIVYYYLTKNLAINSLYIFTSLFIIVLFLFYFDTLKKHAEFSLLLEEKKKLASLDFSLGVQSRVAFYNYGNRWNTESYTEPYILFVFDLYYLRNYYTVHTVVEKEKSVMTLFDSLRDVFETDGSLFRLSDSQYICLVKNYDKSKIDETIKNFDAITELQSNAMEKFAIPYGYHMFTPEKQPDFFIALRIADTKMNEMKKELFSNDEM